MINGKLLVEKLLIYAHEFLELSSLDIIYKRNLLLHYFNIDCPTKEKINEEEIKSLLVPDLLIDEIIKYSMENNICSNEIEGDLFANFIFGELTPVPSEVNRRFKSLRENLGSQSACDYLYNLSIKNYYIRKTAIDKNIMWLADDLEIPLEITINLSKPEKDNKEVAKLLTKKTGSKYPECPLCKENEGFYGNATQAPRTNIRTVSLTLGNEDWGMQYSPYLYFDEHCILFNKTHTPMVINGGTIEKLFDFIELFPDYFVGSNADLPIVGGSILNHEHYQGGKHLMPLQKCKELNTYSSKNYNDVVVDVVDFYNSVIRVSGFNRNTVQAMATDIINAWRNYTDENVGIYAYTDGVNHNTITPIARFLGDNRYCVDLILRNNLTSEEYPDGIFHAHPEYHNIKKEGIGLIEAMGLYILPARLKRQFSEIENIIAHKVEYDKEQLNNPECDLYVHRNMIAEIMKKHPRVKDLKKANAILTEYVNNVCKNILFNTSVFKKDSVGVAAFNKFLDSCGLNLVK